MSGKGKVSIQRANKWFETNLNLNIEKLTNIFFTAYKRRWVAFDVDTCILNSYEIEEVVSFELK